MPKSANVRRMRVGPIGEVGGCTRHEDMMGCSLDLDNTDEQTEHTRGRGGGGHILTGSGLQ